jgi:hypothetical protein
MFLVNSDVAAKRYLFSVAPATVLPSDMLVAFVAEQSNSSAVFKACWPWSASPCYESSVYSNSEREYFATLTRRSSSTVLHSASTSKRRAEEWK